jgi:hypothetical protein
MGKLYPGHASATKKHHRDTHHNESCDFLYQIGFSIDDSSARGGGRQDVSVGACGVDFRLEFKTGDEPLTPAQEKFHREWRGRKIEILRSLSETKAWGLRTLHELRRQTAPKALRSVHQDG